MLAAMEAELEMHIEVLGEGRSAHLPVVLLHGWGQSSQQMQQLGRLLAARRQVILVDLPGFGQSPVPEKAVGAQEIAAALTGRLPKEVLVLGHSFGGKVASYLAIHAPKQVRALVLMGASGVPRQRSFSERQRLRGIRWLGKAAKLADLWRPGVWEQSFVPRFASVDYKKAGKMRPTLVKTLQEDLSLLLPRVKQPALLLWGLRDTETPLEVGRRWHELLPNSTLLELQGHGHDLLSNLGSHLLATYIEPFLDGVEA